MPKENKESKFDLVEWLDWFENLSQETRIEVVCRMVTYEKAIGDERLKNLIEYFSRQKNL